MTSLARWSSAVGHHVEKSTVTVIALEVRTIASWGAALYQQVMCGQISSRPQWVASSTDRRNTLVKALSQRPVIQRLPRDGRQKKGKRIAPLSSKYFTPSLIPEGDWTLACSLDPILQMGIWARLDSRLQPPPHIFSRRNFLTFDCCVQLATGRCGRLRRGAVLTSPKSRSVN